MNLIQAYRALIDCGHENLFIDPKMDISFYLPLTEIGDIYSCIRLTCHQWETPEIVDQNGTALARCYRHSGNKWSLLPRHNIVAAVSNASTALLIPLNLDVMKRVNAANILTNML